MEEVARGLKEILRNYEKALVYQRCHERGKMKNMDMERRRRCGVVVTAVETAVRGLGKVDGGAALGGGLRCSVGPWRGIFQKGGYKCRGTSKAILVSIIN